MALTQRKYFFADFTQERMLRLTNCEVTRTAQQALVKK